MKLSKLIILIGMVLLLVASVNAYYRDDYWECTSQGEASQGDAFGRRAGDVCTSSCCILCVSEDPGIDCSGAQPICTCNGEGGTGEVDVTPPVITIENPVDGETYDIDDILMTIKTDEKAFFMKYAFDDSGLRALCSNCFTGTRTETNMQDGTHTLRIQARDTAGNLAEKSITFIVDTELPEIHSTNPGNNAYVKAGNQDFELTYTENSVKNVKLFYKRSTDSTYSVVESNSCSNGEEESCVLNANLGGFSEGTQLDLYFELSDEKNSVQSSVFRVTVDNARAELPFEIVSPEFDSLHSSRSVEFAINSFIPDSEILYSKDNGNKFSSICRSECDSFVKKISLSDGDNHLIFRLEDVFGNTYDQDFDLFIDSRSPKVSSLEPRGGRDPIGGEPFVVEYTEEELVTEVILRYTDQSSNVHELVRTDCPTGKKVECVFDIDLSSVDGQMITYYAEVRDRVSSDMSRDESALVDTSVPVLTSGEIAAVQGKKVTFDLTVNEPVTLEYSDNGAKWKRLCGDCASYNRDQSFKDGQHNVIVRAVDDAGNSDEVSFDFLVDSKAPRASGLEIDDATNGAIIFEYRELNPVEVVLNYRPAGEEGDWDQVVYTDCPGDDRNGVCVLNVDLSSYEGQELEFFATIEDITGKIDDTRIEEAVVDTIPPVLNLIAPVEGQTFDSRMLVKMTSSEDITFEYSVDGDRFTKLCSRCNEYDRERSEGDGAHVVVFHATDWAGNVVQVVRNVVGGVSQ